MKGNNILDFFDPYLRKSSRNKKFETRSLIHINAATVILYAKMYRQKYRLRSVIVGIKKYESGMYAKFIAGRDTLKKEVMIQDYDIKEILEKESENFWVFCLVSDNEFIEIDIDIDINPTLDHIGGNKNTLWEI